jgi:hypothetical protein
MVLPELCVVTNAYNESVNLPRWLSYYAGQVGAHNCFVLDHGSTDGSTDALPREVNRLRLPRHREFDQHIRAAAVSDQVACLLRYYDAVLYVDCDEFVVADPRKYAGLRDFLAQHPEDWFTPLGFNVWHLPGVDPELQAGVPLLSQRPHVRFMPVMCKTTLVRKRLHWGPGFHYASEPPHFSDLYLLHTKTCDLPSSLARLAITRELASSSRGSHQQMSDDEWRQRFTQVAKLPRLAWSDEAIAGLRQVVLDCVECHHPDKPTQRRHVFKPPGIHQRGVYALPDAFRTLF